MNDTTETWKPVVGWEGFYEVSDHGRVWSNERMIETRAGYVRRKPGRVLAMSPTAAGYPRVCMSGPEGTSWKYIHELMLEAFVGPRPEGHVACHWDDNPADNRLEQLRWGTVSQNMYDKIRNGRDPNVSKTHCLRGHEFTPANTYRQTISGRGCRTCRADRSRAWRMRKHPTIAQ